MSDHGPSIEVPGSVHKKHECPPDREAMMQKLVELQVSWEKRLANMKRVITNLDADRARLSARVQRLTELLESVALVHGSDATIVQGVLREEW